MNDIDPDYMKSNDLEYVKALGKGGYGVVHEVYSKHYNTKFALKIIPPTKFNEAESKSLIMLDTPYVTRLYKISDVENGKYLLMEFCPDSLYQKIMEQGKLPEEKALYYSKQILMALMACHSQNISHGDIKPSNILIDAFDRAKLCDFGLANYSESFMDYENFQGSFPYIAPEVFLRMGYNRYKADVYSFGVTLFTMLTGKTPWTGDGKRSMKEIILTDTPRFELIRNENLRNILKKCMSIDAERRPSIEMLLSCSLFNDKKNIMAGVKNNVKLTWTKSNIVKPLSRLTTIKYKHKTLW